MGSSEPDRLLGLFFSDIMHNELLKIVAAAPDPAYPGLSLH